MASYTCGRESLQGSNRYSVWQRHTTDGLYRSQQPVGLRHIRIEPCVVAALQAALVGRCCPGNRRVLPWNHRVLPWAVSVAALQAAFGRLYTEAPVSVAALRASAEPERLQQI